MITIGRNQDALVKKATLVPPKNSSKLLTLPPSFASNVKEIPAITTHEKKCGIYVIV